MKKLTGTFYLDYDSEGDCERYEAHVIDATIDESSLSFQFNGVYRDVGVFRGSGMLARSGASFSGEAEFIGSQQAFKATIHATLVTSLDQLVGERPQLTLKGEWLDEGDYAPYEWEMELGAAEPSGPK